MRIVASQSTTSLHASLSCLIYKLQRTPIHSFIYVLISSHHIFVVKIITSKGSKESLGLAYIWFAREVDALLAVKEMDGKVQSTIVSPLK